MTYPMQRLESDYALGYITLEQYVAGMEYLKSKEDGKDE